MPLYTFIMDFEGGTYLSQVRAPDVKTAPGVWAAGLKPGEIPGLGSALLRRLQSKVASDEPVPVTGLERVWCSSALVRGRSVLVHFVET